MASGKILPRHTSFLKRKDTSMSPSKKNIDKSDSKKYKNAYAAPEKENFPAAGEYLYRRGIMRYQLIKEMLEKNIAEKEKQDLEGATFTPHINDNSRKLAAKNGSLLSRIDYNARMRKRLDKTLAYRRQPGNDRDPYGKDYLREIEREAVTSPPPARPRSAIKARLDPMQNDNFFKKNMQWLRDRADKINWLQEIKERQAEDKEKKEMIQWWELKSNPTSETEIPLVQMQETSVNKISNGEMNKNKTHSPKMKKSVRFGELRTFPEDDDDFVDYMYVDFMEREKNIWKKLEFDAERSAKKGDNNGASSPNKVIDLKNIDDEDRPAKYTGSNRSPKQDYPNSTSSRNNSPVHKASTLLEQPAPQDERAIRKLLTDLQDVKATFNRLVDTDDLSKLSKKDRVALRAIANKH